MPSHLRPSPSLLIAGLDSTVPWRICINLEYGLNHQALQAGPCNVAPAERRHAAGRPGGIQFKPSNAGLSKDIGGCSGCRTPNSSLALDRTFTGGLFDPGINQAKGGKPLTALQLFWAKVYRPLPRISVICILSNSLTSPPGVSDMTFLIDGVEEGNFSHTPTGTRPRFVSNTTVFTSSDLPLQMHNITVQNGRIGGGPSLAILDFMSIRTREIIIGSVVSSALIMVALCLWALWFKRRRKGTAKVEDAAETGAVSPFMKTYRPVSMLHVAPTNVPQGSTRAVVGNAAATQPDARSLTASSIRRQYLQRELRAAQERIVDLEDLPRHNDRISDAARGGRILRVLSARIGATSPQVPSAELDDARRRNEELVARIRELEALMESAWALGLSDDPPPGYTA
ncbi:hypothetical protein FB451DRAFT_1372046 [Mycena latifolia]|nr:hypothetical protein FB451DRAFT_1372046 [Mycena latifolia]